MAGLERAYREEWTTVVAALARRLGDLQAAEDAVAEAFAELRRDRPAAVDRQVLAEVTHSAGLE